MLLLRPTLRMKRTSRCETTAASLYVLLKGARLHSLLAFTSGGSGFVSGLHIACKCVDSFMAMRTSGGLGGDPRVLAEAGDDKVGMGGLAACSRRSWRFPALSFHLHAPEDSLRLKAFK